MTTYVEFDADSNEPTGVVLVVNSIETMAENLGSEPSNLIELPEGLVYDKSNKRLYQPVEYPDFTLIPQGNAYRLTVSIYSGEETLASIGSGVVRADNIVEAMGGLRKGLDQKWRVLQQNAIVAEQDVLDELI